jgi:hypothetical protein
MTDRSAEYRAIVDQYSPRRKLKRPPFILNNLVYIPLQNGNTAFTEAEYYELVIGCSWSEMVEGYVQGHYKYSPRRKLHKWLWYHINGEIPKNMCMDHINRNRLDNRLENLRVVTYSDNARNAKKRGGTSKYPGVSFCSRDKKWRAFIQKELKQYSLGYHDTEEEAFAAYYAKAVELGVEHSIPKISQI